MDCIELSIKSLDEKCQDFAKQIQLVYQPDLVIYVARGSYLIGKSVVKVFKVPLIAVGAQRKGNELKELVAPFLSLFPRWLCNLLRRCELKSNIHGVQVERHIEFLDDISLIEIASIKKVLIVDDSVDTGSSMLAVRNLVESKFPNSEIKTAVLNVMSQSKDVIKVDYSLYEDAMLRTPMSKDSREYKEFCQLYKEHLMKGMPKGR